MDIRKVKKLIELLEESGIAELEIHEGEESVRISRYSSSPLASAHTASAPVVVLPQETPEVPVVSARLAETDEDLLPDGHVVTSPMVGTFYASTSPGTPAFVNVGDSVRVGETLCIIEAMKILNHIEADKAGIVQAVLVQNSQPVEYGQPLFVVK